MEEDDSFLHAIQEIFSLPQLIAYENADSIMHQSLYERNPIKHVISEKAKEELQKCKYKDFILYEITFWLKQYRARMDRVQFERLLLKPSYSD